jgi:hypothetical protein
MGTHDKAGTNQKDGASTHLPGGTLYEAPAPADAAAVRHDAKQHAFLNTKEAADYLRLGRSCLANWCCAGGGAEYILAGRKILYERSALAPGWTHAVAETRRRSQHLKKNQPP